MTRTVHNYRPRQFHRTSNGENPSSGYRDMGSASLAAAHPPEPWRQYPSSPKGWRVKRFHFQTPKISKTVINRFKTKTTLWNCCTTSISLISRCWKKVSFFFQFHQVTLSYYHQFVSVLVWLFDASIRFRFLDWRFDYCQCWHMMNWWCNNRFQLDDHRYTNGNNGSSRIPNFQELFHHYNVWAFD